LDCDPEYEDITSLSVYQSTLSRVLEDFNVVLPPLSCYMRSGATDPLIRNLVTMSKQLVSLTPRLILNRRKNEPRGRSGLLERR